MIDIRLILASLILSFSGAKLLNAQSIPQIDESVEGVNWYNQDFENSKVVGISVDKAYDELLKDKTPKQKVIVAVIDGGVDIHHEDLEGRIWVNAKEIPNNNIDDDNNGYVDDVNGWNFIGNESGENVVHDNLEITRIIRAGETDSEDYNKANELYKKDMEKRTRTRSNLRSFEKVYRNSQKVILEYTGVEVHSKKDLANVNSNHPSVIKAKEFLSKKYSQGVTEEGLEAIIERNNVQLDYYLNVDFDSRTIIGDDENNLQDKSYGNNDVIGPKASHGTSSAGVIAAKRNNGIGINGIAENVEIMVLRVVPDGDEHDKDVALAIMYAVDHGAKVINMSFGKSFSPRKEFVDKAVKYAEEKGVLLIHSAGNSGENLDENKSYPCAEYLDGKVASNWVNVGASNAKLNKEFPGVFSNYGKTTVDVFSPGVDVTSLDTNNTYSTHSGTSIAGPMVAAVAATIWSYYPELSTEEMVQLLKDSSFKIVKPKKVLTPGLTGEKRQKTKFSELSTSGGVVNLYNALKLLEK